MPETLTATTHVGTTRLAGQIGAEITGADTGTPLSDDVVARIRQALLDHKVVFLRGQSLNCRRQVAFAERLGPLTRAGGAEGLWAAPLRRVRAEHHVRPRGVVGKGLAGLGDERIKGHEASRFSQLTFGSVSEDRPRPRRGNRG